MHDNKVFKSSKYYWLHIPSGKTGEREFDELYKYHLLEMLNKWNGSNPKVWKYWS